MKSFRQYITEVFDKPYKWRGGSVAKGSITPDNKNAIEEYTFKTSDGGTIEFTANHFWGLRNYTGHTIAIEFIKRDAQYGHPTYDMTGEGDAIRIMATVLDIIKSIIKKHEPMMITFSADKIEGSKKTGRAGAYGAIVKRFAGKLGYKSDAKDSVDRTDWKLVKK